MCIDVGDEPTLHYATANCEAYACLDVVAWDFWNLNRQCGFLDIKVFNPFGNSFCNLLCPDAMLPMNKKRGELMMRGWGRSRKLAFILCKWWHGSICYHCLQEIGFYVGIQMGYKLCTQCLFLLRRRVSFSLLRFAIMCLRGYRSSFAYSNHWPISRAVWMLLPSYCWSNSAVQHLTSRVVARVFHLAWG